MCFYNDDCDWTANVCVESTRTDGERTCDECHAKIHDGATSHHIFQQESETCKACEDGFCDCPLDADGDPVCISGDCQCEEPTFGETFDYCRCDECEKFLEAVEAAEIEAGCPKYAARPSLCGMSEEIGDGDVDDAKRYFRKALTKSPELKASGYLGRMWRRMF